MLPARPRCTSHRAQRRISAQIAHHETTKARRNQRQLSQMSPSTDRAANLAGSSRNSRLACLGLGGWLRSEWMAGSDRKPRLISRNAHNLVKAAHTRALGTTMALADQEVSVVDSKFASLPANGYLNRSVLQAHNTLEHPLGAIVLTPRCEFAMEF